MSKARTTTGTDEAALERLDDEALAKLVKERENEPTIPVSVEDLSRPDDTGDESGLKAEEMSGEYRIGTKHVGWVRPEAVTRQEELSGWTDTTLGELAEFEMGQAPPGNECNKEGKGIVFVKAGEFADLYPVEVEWTTKPLKFGRKDDVFICVVGATAGKLNLGIDCAIGRSVAAIRPRDGVDTKFVYYQLMPWVLKLRAASSGSAQGVISKAQLNEVPFKIAPLNQQKRIVAEIEKQFSRLDEAITNLKRVKANLKRYKAAVLKAAVEGRLVETEAELARREGRSYETGEQLLQRILETRRSQWLVPGRGKGKGKYKEPAAPDTTDLPEFPEGWVRISISALLREPLRNGHSAKATNNPNGLRAFTLSAVTEGDFSERNTKLTVADPSRVADLWAMPGDIYVERSNTPELVGTTCLYNGPAKFAFIPDLLIRIRVCALVLPRYVELALQSDFGRRYFKDRAQGISGTMPKIDQAAIESYPVSMPPLSEQHRIVAEVDRRLFLLRETEAQVDANLQRAGRLRQSALGRMFAPTELERA